MVCLRVRYEEDRLDVPTSSPPSMSSRSWIERQASASVDPTRRGWWLAAFRSRLPGRLAGLWWPDPVGPHHLVVLVLDDVAVPDEMAGVGEPQPQPGHLARVR